MVQLLVSIDHHELTLSNIVHASRTISVAPTYICIFNPSPASRTISVARGYLFIFYLTFSCVTDNLRRTQVYNHKSNIFLKKHINDLTIITIVGYHNLILWSPFTSSLEIMITWHAGKGVYFIRKMFLPFAISLHAFVTWVT